MYLNLNYQSISILIMQVTMFCCPQDTVLTASPDSTIRVWNVPTSQTIQLLRVHEGPVSGLSLHPTGDYVLSTSTDQHWAFSDIRTGRLLAKVGVVVLVTRKQT